MRRIPRAALVASTALVVLASPLAEGHFRRTPSKSVSFAQEKNAKHEEARTALEKTGMFNVEEKAVRLLAEATDFANLWVQKNQERYMLEVGESEAALSCEDVLRVIALNLSTPGFVDSWEVTDSGEAKILGDMKKPELKNTGGGNWTVDVEIPNIQESDSTKRMDVSDKVLTYVYYTEIAYRELESKWLASSLSSGDVRETMAAFCCNLGAGIMEFVREDLMLNPNTARGIGSAGEGMFELNPDDMNLIARCLFIFTQRIILPSRE